MSIYKGNIIMTNPGKANVAFAEGRAHLEAGSNIEAMKYLMQASLLEPDNAEYQAWLAKVYNEQGNYSGAREAANAALELDPECALAYRQRGYVLYAGEKDYTGAVQDYSQTIELEPDDAVAYYWRGRAYFMADEDTSADSDLSRAIQLDPAFRDAYLWRGKVRKSAGKVEEAISDYSQAIRLKPDTGLAYLERGRCFDALCKYPQAIQDFSRALELDPKDAEAYEKRAGAYMATQDFASSVEDFSRAILLTPAESYLYMSRGLAHRLQGNSQAALEDFTRAIQLDPQWDVAYECRGEQYLFGEKDYSKAVQDYSEAIRLNAENPSTLTMRGLAYAAQEKYQEAESDLSAAIRLDPQDPEAYQIRGDVAMEQYRMDEAVQDYSKALELDPDDEEVKKKLAGVKEFMSGEGSTMPRISGESIKLFDQALTLMQNMGDGPDPRTARNAISYLTLAIEKAGAPFARAHAFKALLFLEDLDDANTAWTEAEAALKLDPLEFRAQNVKTRIAGGSVTVSSVGAGGLLKSLFSGSAKQSYNASYEVSAAKASQRRFNSEAKRLMDIFQSLCSQPLDAGEYLYFAEQMVDIADRVIENRIPLDRKLNLYECVAATPTNNLRYQSEAEKQGVQEIKLLAKGRVGSFR